MVVLSGARGRVKLCVFSLHGTESHVAWTFEAVNFVQQLILGGFRTTVVSLKNRLLIADLPTAKHISDTFLNDTKSLPYTS